MTYHEIFNTFDEKRESPLPSREESIRRATKNRFDIIIIGGGIHGASAARLAALNGLNVCLLERNDYACETSSRSSKMAHGGLRYLELFDFEQVREGIKAREQLFVTAPHLCIPYDFFVPTKNRGVFFDLKLKAGLTLYDLMSGKAKRRHRKAEGGYLYTDGLMNDTRIVIETILSARQEGALCINHAEVILFKHEFDGSVSVTWRDTITGEKHDSVCSAILNCAGPWVASAGRITPADFGNTIAFSRGVHLLFSVPWSGPAQFLPMEEKSRYYFVWPHPTGTMVGTTEKVILSPPFDPIPEADEVTEILSRIERDLPDRGLHRGTLHYAFAGVRTLPTEGSVASSARLSRKHRWMYGQGMLSLIGGKFTSASWTVFEGLQKLIEIGGNKVKLSPMDGRKLPGASGKVQDLILQFEKEGLQRGIEQKLLTRTANRLGGRVKYFLGNDRYFNPIQNRILEGEVILAIQQEGAVTLEDLMRRRLDLEYEPDHGLVLLPDLIRILSSDTQNWDFKAEEEAIRQRLAKVHEAMKK